MVPKPIKLSGVHEYLARRWAQGCTSGWALMQEIGDLGYTGNLCHVGPSSADWRCVRRAPPWHAGRRVNVDTVTTFVPGLIDQLTTHLVWLIVAAPFCLEPRGLPTDALAARVDAFEKIYPRFFTMRALDMRFRGILLGGHVGTLTVWLHDADRSTLHGIRRFVHTLRRDLAAVGSGAIQDKSYFEAVSGKYLAWLF